MNKIRIMALGGLDEDGKNMTLVEIDEDILIIDCGLKYPGHNLHLELRLSFPDFFIYWTKQK